MRRSSLRWIAPFVLFALLAGLTALVWWEQVRHQHALLRVHTEDICVQVSRRLEIFIDARLDAGMIFARRWATYETRDFSPERFESLAELFLEELRGMHAVSLVPAGGGAPWIVPAENESLRAFLASRDNRPPPLPRTGPSEALVSAPVTLPGGESAFYAVQSLRRGAEPLGELVVEFRARVLFNDCLHTRVRSEFDFVIEDDDHLLFLHAPGGSRARILESPDRVARSFPVRNRSWMLSVAPRATKLLSVTSSYSVVVFGLVLSLSLALLAHLLLQRIEVARGARDLALQEVVERRRAEEAAREAVLRQEQLARKVLAAEEEERARISRDLHDGLGQALTALSLELDWLRRGHLEPRGPNGGLGRAGDLLETSMGELQRICRGLRPPLLDDLGLESAVRELVRDFQVLTSTEVTLDLQLDEDEALPRETSLTLYRIIQEALTNVARHAAARSVEVHLWATDDRVELRVRDDGQGFDPTHVEGDVGLGLAGMTERARLVNGTLHLRSRPGAGTTVEVSIPAAARAAKEGP